MRRLAALLKRCLTTGLVAAGLASTARADWVPHTEAALNRISVANASRIVGVNAADEIFMYGGGTKWVKLPGAATDISTGPDGALWVVNRAGHIYREISGGLQNVAGPADGGTPRHIAVLEDQQVVRRILEHLGLPPNAPRLEPAHEEPQTELWPTGPPHDEFAQPPAPEEFDQRWGTIDFAQCPPMA